jgi:hypothetical protein
MSADCLAILGKSEKFASLDSGDDALALGSRVVADRRREWIELPESIDDKLVDLRCDAE